MGTFTNRQVQSMNTMYRQVNARSFTTHTQIGLNQPFENKKQLLSKIKF